MFIICLYSLTQFILIPRGKSGSECSYDLRFSYKVILFTLSGHVRSWKYYPSYTASRHAGVDSNTTLKNTEMHRDLWNSLRDWYRYRKKYSGGYETSLLAMSCRTFLCRAALFWQTPLQMVNSKGLLLAKACYCWCTATGYNVPKYRRVYPNVARYSQFLTVYVCEYKMSDRIDVRLRTHSVTRSFVWTQFWTARNSCFALWEMIFGSLRVRRMVTERLRM
jgi:hypothetical protein